MLFNGQTCVEGFEGSKFNCPQESGKYRFIGNEKQYWDCINGKAALKNCQQGEFFDGLECVVKGTDQSDK